MSSVENKTGSLSVTKHTVIMWLCVLIMFLKMLLHLPMCNSSGMNMSLGKEMLERRREECMG